MNSIMQQLFMIPNFRRLVLEVESPAKISSDPSQSLSVVKPDDAANAVNDDEDVLF